MQFTADLPYTHGTLPRIGVLLVNLGTPEAPLPGAVRPYLRRFLGDPRVVETPTLPRRLLWKLILNAVILRTRPPRTAAAYQKIWQNDGSPLLAISRRQQLALQQALAENTPSDHRDLIRVQLAMSYSAPTIATALRDLRRHHCTHLLALPLYPQYAGSTTGAVFTDIATELTRWRRVPHFRFIADYCDDPRYIAALAAHIAAHRAEHGTADKLLFSFHGTPLQMLKAGDPYHCHCHKTARQTAAALGLSENDWMVAFQSRFGKAAWLRPYTDVTLQSLPAQGIRRLQIVCPAFAADCLETLEEIAQENRALFRQAGGDHYDYIPALNDASSHIAFLRDLTSDAIADWRPTLARRRAQAPAQQAAHARQLAAHPADYQEAPPPPRP